MYIKKIPFLLLPFFVGLMLFSCRSMQDMVYFQDIQQNGQSMEQLALKSDYLIQKNDNLYVNIQSIDPEISKLFNMNSGAQSGGAYQMYDNPASQYLYGYHVDESGQIRLPVLGSIAVEGLTLEQAQAKVQERADEYLKDSAVKIKLLNFKVTVFGEVAKPGTYNNYYNAFTIFDAIGMAGGITDNANIKRVLVMRPVYNEMKTFRLDLSAKSILTSEVYYLQPNDVIYIEPDKDKQTRLNSPIYSLLFSSISMIILIFNFFGNTI